MGFFGGLPLGDLASLVLLLAAESLVGDETLDARGLIEGLVTLLDLTADDVLGNIILLAENEGFLDLANSLGTESTRLLVIGETGNFILTLLEHLEGKDAKIGASDAASDGLALALTSSLGTVGLDS